MAYEDYEPVAARLARWLQAEQENGFVPRLVTSMESEPGADICVFKAELWRCKVLYYPGELNQDNPIMPAILLATGWAEEIRNSSHITKTSHVEVCETSAIGRALANAGYAGSDWTKRASREEMQKADRYQDGPQPPASFEARGKLQGRITDKQAGYIAGAFKRSGHPVPAGLSTWSKEDASSWIEAHKTGRNPADIERPSIDDQEEPF